MKNYVFTGVSGSGRIELLNELKKTIDEDGYNANIYDVGKIIYDSAKDLDIILTDQKVLDVDRNLLKTLRKLAILKVANKISEYTADFNFIGVHATFRWKGRIIKGLAYKDLEEIKPKIDGIINIIDDVKRICDVNSKNPKWDDNNRLTVEETNNWIMEEEFVTELLADFLSIPIYLVARNHNVNNLADLFTKNKKKIYLSYPITSIKDENPELLKDIKMKYIPMLEENFIVFDPLAIKDMELTYKGSLELPSYIEKITPKAAELLKSRTIERDFQFIDQSDFVIVLYLTEKVSPGVISEIIYASTNNKPVYMVFPYSKSPFLTNYATNIFVSIDDLIQHFSLNLI